MRRSIWLLMMGYTFCLFATQTYGHEIKSTIGAKIAAKTHSCPPCAHHSGYSEDIYHAGGVCPVCDMKLIDKPKFNLLDQPVIGPGSGNFVMTGNVANPGKTIVVFYHRPEKWNQDTRVLFVVPGSGRNAWDYRDVWKDTSERNNILILSPAYPEEQYDFSAYHMGGVIKNLQFSDQKAAQAGRETSRYRLKDEDITFDLNEKKDTWLFGDFDRIFDAVISSTGLNQSQYDMFGHSAGGQLLHRLVLFQPEHKARTIIAANSGLYTLPNWDLPPIFGLKGTALQQESIEKSFSNKLIVMVGEKDNADESGGTLLHTPVADQQGLGRLSRAKTFYHSAEETAQALGVSLNWQLKIAKNVGHDYQKMSKQAAKLLYEK